MKRKRPISQKDQVDLFQRLVDLAAGEGEESVTIPTGLARAIAELAKRTPKPTRGPRSISGRQQVRDSMTVLTARRYKKKLRADAKAQGRKLTAPDASRKAAAMAKDKTGSRLSVDRIVDKMSRRKSRR